MNIRLLIILTLLTQACTKPMNLQFYKLITQSFSPENNQLKEVENSKTYIDIDFETGDFKGKYNNTPFYGNFVIEHTAAGFVKGFVYTVSLGYLSKEITNDKSTQQFFDQLISTTQIYFNPQKILEPDYINIELMQTEADTGLYFTKIIKESAEF